MSKQAKPPYVTLRIPLAPMPTAGYTSRHVDVHLGDLGLTMRRVFDGLDLAGARLASGKRVASTADALRWILEQLDAPDPV